MTYNDNLEKSQQEATPELYTFTHGSTVDRYTSYARDLEFMGETYRAAPIKRSSFSKDAEFGTVAMSVTAPLIDTLVHYIANQPAEPVSITVHRAVESDLADYIVLFAGVVKSVSIRDRIATASCEANSMILAARQPTVIFQSRCNHILFDSGCGLEDHVWRTEITVEEILADGSVRSQALAGFSGGWFTGGRAATGNDFRMITHHSGDTIRLHIPFDSRVQAGSRLRLWPGCDGHPETCKDKFNNLSRFCGMPYIPSHNPCVYGFK